MSTLTPNPVTTEDLINSVSDINKFNDGVKAQAVQPRTSGVESITVQVADDPAVLRLAAGNANANVVNVLRDTATPATFITDGITVGDIAYNTTSGAFAKVTAVTSETELALDSDAFPLGTEAYDINPKAFWVQKFGGGEWKRANVVHGINPLVAYTLPVNGATVNVHDVVYPWVIADIANYPAK